MHTTNYYSTFISVSEDCKATEAEIPKQRGEGKSVAQLQFEMISQNPYRFTSDEVLLQIHALRNNRIPNEELKDEFFFKGQPCFRVSPLVKRYGWGVHFDENGCMAVYGIGTDNYRMLSSGTDLKQLKGMKNKRG